MKYSKTYHKPEDGLYYVLIGTKRFANDTGSKTKEEALEKAAVMSAKYYLEQAVKAMDKAGTVINKLNDEYTDINTQVGLLKDIVEEAHTKHKDYDYYDPCTWI